MFTGKILIVCNGKWKNPEIEISGNAKSLVNLGKLLNRLEKSCEIEAEQTKSSIYSENLKSLILTKSDDNEFKDLIKIYVKDRSLQIKGNQIALFKLGQSLINVFGDDAFDGEHIHLDYFEGGPLIAPTNCDLIVLCNSKII